MMLSAPANKDPWQLPPQALKLHPAMCCLFMFGYTADVIGTQGVLEQDVQSIQKLFSTTTLPPRCGKPWLRIILT